MGCGASSEQPASGGDAPASRQVTHVKQIKGASLLELWSSASLSCGSLVKKNNNNKPYSREFPRNGDQKQLALDWGVSASDPVSMRYTTGGEVIGEMKKTLDGANVVVEEGKCFHVILASFFPWATPCAYIKKATYDNKVKSFLLIEPQVHVVDIYISVDGKPQTDGIMIKQNARLTNPAIEAGVPEGAFCSLVSTQFSDRDEHGMHIPVIINKPEHAELMRSSEEYGAAFTQAFINVIARAGEGTHTYTLRVAPRGHADADEEWPEHWYGISNVQDFGKMDENTKAFAKEHVVGGVFPSADTPLLKATFQLSVPPSVLSEAAALSEKAAPEFMDIGQFPDGEIETLIDAAKSLAKGTPARIATDSLGKDVSGEPTHIILEKSGDYGATYGTSTNKKGGRVHHETDFVYVWALWTAPDDGDGEAEGVMTRFRLDRETIKNFEAVFPIRWTNNRTFNASRIKNKSIQDAVERDADKY